MSELIDAGNGLVRLGEDTHGLFGIGGRGRNWYVYHLPSGALVSGRRYRARRDAVSAVRAAVEKLNDHRGRTVKFLKRATRRSDFFKVRHYPSVRALGL